MDALVKFNERFLSLEADGINCDCEFIVGHQNVVVKGHKLLFSAASEIFRAIFYGNLKEEKAVRIENLDPDSFLVMKQFIYTGCAEFTSSFHALSTYNAACKYMIPALSYGCEIFIEDGIEPSEVLQFYEYCKTNDITQFEDLCCEVIQRKTDEVIRSDFFLTSKSETVEFILKSPILNLKSEIEVFKLFENWAMAEAERTGIEDMGSSFTNLKKHIRFLTISCNEYASCVEDSPLLTQEEKHAIALNLFDFNSKPLPVNLSVERKDRNFLLAYEHEKVFMVSIEDIEDENDSAKHKNIIYKD